MCLQKESRMACSHAHFSELNSTSQLISTKMR